MPYLVPKSLRWKHYFLYNMFWPYIGPNQRDMIWLGNSILNISSKFNFYQTDPDDYIKSILNFEYKIYLSDNIVTNKEREKLYIDNNIIITQKDQIEEFTTTLVAKLFFSEVKGYFVGDFDIPSFFGEQLFGMPDIIGLKGSFINDLKSKGIIGFGGLIEDLFIWQYIKNKPQVIDDDDEAIVIEVKSSNQWSSAYDKLYFRKDTHQPGYLKSHCFDKGYACFGSFMPSDYIVPPCNDAGSLIFGGKSPYQYFEDPICSESLAAVSSKRKKDSVKVYENRKHDLFTETSRRSARLMLAGIPVGVIFPGIEKQKVNSALMQIDNVVVEDIINNILFK